MRNNESNITFNVRNITLNLENIKRYLTERTKIIILVSVIMMLSFANIILCSSNSFNVSALSYSSDVNVNFTFNPTISISLSSYNLDISNLIPGNTLDSNNIHISVASNNANGYTMLATVGNTEYNNSNLNHSNSINTFSSIATSANLANLVADNTWGYSYSIDSGYSWSNYNGLSLYSDTGTTLINKLGPAESNIDFKIAAKVSSTQASGTYSNVINFIAITRPNPVSLEDAYNSYYLSTGKTKHNGYYVMQDMNSTICNNAELLDSELQVIDIRDEKVYWIAKLRDGHCWMTQNLDLDIDDTKTYTYYDTDLGWTTNDENATWQPMEGHSTIAVNSNGYFSNWVSSYVEPYSGDPGDKYIYTSNSSSNDTIYASLSNCVSATNDNVGCAHYHVGNYYNWAAAIATNDASNFNTRYENAANSICPAGWRLPIARDANDGNREIGNLLHVYGITNGVDSSSYTEGGFNLLRKAPLYYIRSGNQNSPKNMGQYGNYSSSTVYNSSMAYWFFIYLDQQALSAYNWDVDNSLGKSVRCLAR